MITKKYNKFSDNIIGYCPIKNAFGGYTIREFINEETMYQIILSSNSEFSKSFKKDVSKILCQLRKDEQLIITNNGNLEAITPEQVVKRKRRVKELTGCNTSTAWEAFDSSKSNMSCVYLFTIGTVEKLRDVMNIDNKYDDDNYVVKYGMTENIPQRTQQHEKTFRKITNDNIKLTYYALIVEEHISNAEVDIKKQLIAMNAIFRFEDMTELAIVSRKQLKELGETYTILDQLYGGPLKNIILKYQNEIQLQKHENAMENKDKECTMKLLTAEQKNNENLKEEMMYLKKLYEMEKEKSERFKRKYKHYKRLYENENDE